MKRATLLAATAALTIFATSYLAQSVDASSAKEAVDQKAAPQNMVKMVATHISLYVFHSAKPLDADTLRTFAGKDSITELGKRHDLQQVEAMATSALYLPDEHRSAPLSVASLPHDAENINTGASLVSGTIIDASSPAPHPLVSTVNAGVALTAIHTGFDKDILQFYGARIVIRPEAHIGYGKAGDLNYTYVTAPETVLSGNWSVKAGGRMVMEAAAAGGDGFYIVVIQAGHPSSQQVPDHLIETDFSPIFIDNLKF